MPSSSLARAQDVKKRASVVRTEKVGESGNVNESLVISFPANPASKSPALKQLINVHHANIEGRSQSTIVTPKYNALCGMAKCCIMIPINGMMHQVQIYL